LFTKIGDREEYIEPTPWHEKFPILLPALTNAFNNWGIARKAKGDLDGAQKDYGEAVRLRSDPRSDGVRGPVTLYAINFRLFNCEYLCFLNRSRADANLFALIFDSWQE
jgi:hypothetical protein